MNNKPKLFAGTFLAAWLLPAVARAQDAPDLAKLAGFIRWGGVAFALLAVGAAVVALRVISDVA